MNRNHQNRNTQHHTGRGREHVARRQLGPGFNTPMKSNPNEERNVRYSTASFWSEKDYPFIEQGQASYDSPDYSQSSNYVVSDIEPVRIDAKETLRHEHNHDYHGRELSYRARMNSDTRVEGEYRQYYKGVGPKDYKRTDARIEEDLCERLTASTFIDPSRVTVSVVDGVVRIFGDVPARYQKFEIEDLAERVPGVVNVENDIRVKKR